MRLVYLQNTDEAYVAKVEITIKIFGVAFGEKIKTYIKRDSENTWRDEKTNKTVSEREAAHLNKWLNDHQKFVEH